MKKKIHINHDILYSINIQFGEAKLLFTGFKTSIKFVRNVFLLFKWQMYVFKRNFILLKKGKLISNFSVEYLHTYFLYAGDNSVALMYIFEDNVMMVHHPY